ncbi:probable ubiquitin carboxyl-terminal hydrolase FAF-X isoform X2 [Gigantopelta aegis]|uniref:probable ubiquitin carboxyl-terminal hydrolase FAF-X isoform X2 n=1 Tax=Gigantopelta aegis TaxID=1735272 RepID=UPI001B88C1D6|nr:probable ubiquitin carboxyl-terminal hydrolase FAF-X isoform X2 [Gigantopelta aegis]
MTIVMRGSPAAGDSPQETSQQQHGQQQQPPPPQTQPPTTQVPLVTTQPGVTQPAAQPQLAAQPQPAQQPGVSPPSQVPNGSQPDEGGQGDGVVQLADDQEPEFPHVELAKLDEMINRPRWVVPVLPKGELEVLLEASVKLCKEGLDIRSEACQRFFREGLTLSFTKILTDDAVSGWKYEIHRSILKNSEKLIELCVYKLPQDWFPILDLLAMVLNPQCKFHTYNGTRQSETVPAGTQISDETIFARPPDPRTPRGWLVDLVNKFGSLDGFQILHDRFLKGPALSVPVICALIKPFGQCAEVLTAHTVQKFFMPVVEIIPKFLDNLTDDELKKESKTEAKNDALSSIIKALKQLVYRLPNQEETIKSLEIFRLKMILRLLQISSFNGKMNALNEVNKVITNVSFHSTRHNQIDEDEWLTADKMAEWIQQNGVLGIVLRDSLHQPQYVEKLEKILRFMIKEKALTMEDLDLLWEAQSGKHDAIVKNVHDLLAKLAWDFTPEQLDHLFDCFQGSWHHATKKQREKLLELIRRLAEDDKEGVMAHKVLTLLWNLAHSEDVPTEIMDQALTAHIKILDYSCSQDRDAQKIQWINRFVEELKNDKWVLPSLKQIREICVLFSEAPQSFPHSQRAPNMFYRNNVIGDLQSQHSIVMLVSQNLAAYITKARIYAKEHPDEEPSQIMPDGRFSHIMQVQERLRFLRFLLKDGQLWLCEPQARQIWHCLAETAIYITDREACFKWFAKLMGEEPDLDPDITRDFFERNILQLDPSLLTENGMNCFERFFKQVNLKENKLITKRRGGHMMDDLELIGLDYMWRVVLWSPDEVAEKAITLLKDIFTNLGPRLQQNQVEIHEDFIQSCVDRLKAPFDTVSVLEKDRDSNNRVMQESIRMVRVLTVLREYIAECDEAYGEERTILPLSRACRGKLVSLKVRFPNQGRQVEDLEVWSHTNDTVGALRRQILQRVKANANNIKVDLYVNGEQIDSSEDKKLISQIPLRDKMTITAKLVQVGSNMPSSPDSSSDSSAGSPHHTEDGPNVEAEHSLPGVLMSQSAQYAQFLFQLSDLGCQLQVPKLRDTARAVLKLMPMDVHTIQKFRKICLENAKTDGVSQSLEAMFFNASATQVVYNIEVAYCLLMPASDPLSEEAFEFQFNYVRSGGVQLSLNMLTKNNFLPSADLPTRRTAYLTVLKVCKLMLTTVGHAKVQVVVDACHSESQVAPVSVLEHNQAAALQQALIYIPSPDSEFTTRSVAMRLGQHLGEQATGVLPDLSTVKAIQKIAWAASSCSLHLVHASNEEIHKAHEKPKEGIHTDMEDINVAREAMEVLTVCLALFPSALDVLHKDKAWQCFIIDLLLLCKSSRNIRICASDQFVLMATRCSTSPRPLVFFITLLFTVLSSTAKENAKQSHDYFQLLCRLLGFAFANETSLSTADALLNNEITWLKKVRDHVITSGETGTEDALLEGHLGITRELLSFQSPEKKYNIGSEKGGANLIKELVEDFIFPASKIVLQCRKQNGDFPAEQAFPVCSTSMTVIAAFDLLVALCTGCVQNLHFLANMLIDMYYTNETPLTEWEYVPPVGPRPNKGFVGLKNAGATCYMNSVIQQLFMIEPIRNGILGVNGAADDIDEDFLNDDKTENETNIDISEFEKKDEDKLNKTEERKDYNMGVLKQIQVIFGHLAASKLQYHVPRGFWKHFKLWGEPVNLREQHDALEFFNSLVDSLDEALKSLSQPCVLSKVLGGSFADQKICKDCPHRYQREEAFTTLNVDIRNHQNLFESLEQYVKGDLLEGANAYHCEKCNKKVDTVKRLLIKKLPKILAIQLKRFDYDWERECAIKFNDYFEFPRKFDMEPYTVQGVAKVEGEVIDDEEEKPQSTKYRLIGVVVHSGQASGGHYYSYIYYKGTSDPHPKWYKFDDGDVSECKMDDDEEMKNQCFGGEYLGEVYDHMLKRSAVRRQKRWWNAYILVYERIDEMKDEIDSVIKEMQKISISSTVPHVAMPLTIDRLVRKQNILFMHEKNQYCIEYFQFMKKLITCNHVILTHAMQEKLTNEAEQIAMISMELASKFLFTVGFHTKKTLRGSASDWYDALHIHLRFSKTVRSWFAHNVLFAQPARFAEYLLECPSSEVRNAFAKIIVILSHFSLQDGPCPPPLVQGLYAAGQAADPNATLSDHLLVAVLALLRKEVSEHGRHLQQYFHLFLMYLNLGIVEKQQLLRLNVPAQFISVALDEGPGPPIKYQYAELSKLYSVVSHLVRCCDVSARYQCSVACLPNPHGDPQCPQPLIEIQRQVDDMLFNRSNYVKKIIEECNNSEDTTKLLKFSCWENPHFSSVVLGELLWQVAYSYTYELRPYLDLLLQMLLLEDSWQNHRIHNALKGIPDDRDGLFDTIQRSKNHYQKRAYQCIKMMVALFTHCPQAAQMLQTNGDLKRKWTGAVDWLTDELERRPYPGNTQYSYNNWSPPAQSNETSNGYFLERSQSARLTLEKAYELCPGEEPEEGDLTDEQEGNHDDPVPGYSHQPVVGQSAPVTAPQPLPNNQVQVQPVAHPVQPSNQISNQLNQQQQGQQAPTVTTAAPAGNQETGEDDHGGSVPRSGD